MGGSASGARVRSAAQRAVGFRKTSILILLLIAPSLPDPGADVDAGAPMPRARRRLNQFSTKSWIGTGNGEMQRSPASILSTVTVRLGVADPMPPPMGEGGAGDRWVAAAGLAAVVGAAGLAAVVGAAGLAAVVGAAAP